MNTRKNRKRTWKVQESQETQEDAEIVAEELANDTMIAEVKNVEAAAQQQDSNRLLLFLQSWQEAKEAQVNGTLRKDMPESIADLMSTKGYPISVNVARTKIMNFIKKYNLVKKMTAHGKNNEWTHFNTVKKILEFGPPIMPTANVIIPIENIKLEEKASLKENTLKIAERKVSIDAQKSGTTTKHRKEVDLIEIADDDSHLLKPRVYFSESEPVDESDDSDLSDEDLDFENPLDMISFGFHTENGTRPKQAVTVLPPKMPKLDKKIKNPLPALNKIDNHIKPTTVIPNQKPIAQSSLGGQQNLRPILPKQQIIPIPQNMTLPQTMNNGAPQQYLIVRPLTPGNPNNAKTLAIPMGGQFRIGGKPELTSNAQVLRPPANPETKPSSSVNNQVKMVSFPKIPAQITMTNNTPSVESPLVSTASNDIPESSSSVNGQTHINASPCSSPGSATSLRSPSVRQLLTNVIQLETNIFNLQQERLQLERERFEMERDYGKEMLNIFKEIKDKLCDMITVPTASAETKSTTISNTEVEHTKK